MKPVGQAGAGATKIGPNTIYKRYRSCKARVTSTQPFNAPDDPEPWKVRSTPIFYALGDEVDNYPGGSIIASGQIPELTKYSPSSIDDPEANAERLFNDFVQLVNTLNSQNPEYDYVFEFKWEGLLNGPPNPEINFYDLTIGTDQNACEDNCFENYDTTAPTTTFNGELFNVGEYAFKSYGVPHVHEFKNTKNLIIQEGSFNKAYCGDGVTLVDCDLENAISAFKEAKLNEKDFIIVGGKGAVIAANFAERAIINKISIDMVDQYNIDERAFYSCAAKTLTIAGDCKEIKDFAFSDNSFGHGLSPFPASITVYGPDSFNSSEIKSVEFPASFAVFARRCFLNNNIEVGFSANGLFKTDSFKGSINDKTGGTYSISGAVDNYLVFSNNNFGNLVVDAFLNADGAFMSSAFNNSINISNGANFLNSRHAFTTPRTAPTNIYLYNPAAIEDSYRTFQGFTFGSLNTVGFDNLPCATVSYYPKDKNSVDFDSLAEKNLQWDGGRLGVDCMAFSAEEAKAFSEEHPGLAIEWVTCAPKEVTVAIGTGGWVETFEQVEPAIIPNTNSTIQEAAYQGVEFSDDAQVSYSAYLIYRPWGFRKIQLMGSPSLTDECYLPYGATECIPGYDSNGYSTEGVQLLAEGEGFWEVQASRVDSINPELQFAPQSRIFLQADLRTPQNVTSTNADAYPNDACSITNYVICDSNPDALDQYADVLTSARVPYLQQLGEYVVNGNTATYPGALRMHVPEDFVTTANSDSFRIQHMFDGEVVAFA